LTSFFWQFVCKNADFLFQTHIFARKNAMYQKQTSQLVAQELLETGAVRLSVDQPFTWASGWKSPIYCDNRLTLSFPETRSFIKAQLVQCIKMHFPQTEAIAGVATAGIPQGALVADALELPFLYVRSSPKNHGMENLIEGKVTPNQKVLLIEDLISTGGSSLKAAQAVRNQGMEVVGMLAVFTYGFPISFAQFEQAAITLHTLSDYSTLIQIALGMGTISESQLQTLNQWRENPEKWPN